MRVETVDEAVLRTIGADVLRPAVTNAVIEGVLREFEQQNVERDISRLRAELQTIEREVTNLTKAIAAGGHLEPLLTESKVRQNRSQELRGTIATWAALSPGRFDQKVIEHKVRAQLVHWRGLLTKHVQDGRQFLREALTGRSDSLLNAERTGLKGKSASIVCSAQRACLHLLIRPQAHSNKCGRSNVLDYSRPSKSGAAANVSRSSCAHCSASWRVSMGGFMT